MRGNNYHKKIFEGPCPPYALTDAVFVLDSSPSVGSQDWKFLMWFVRDLLQYEALKAFDFL